jgi:hypothetical protein
MDARRCETFTMGIEQWWPNLSDSAKEWLIANNGGVVTSSVVEQIVAAGGVVDAESDWVSESGPDGLLLSDHATDWIEAVANDEI